MPDLVIHRADGWEELLVSEGALGAEQLRALWGYAGERNADAMAGILVDAGYELPSPDGLEDVRIILVPDDMLGERYRIWVKHKPTSKDWRPKGRPRRRP